MKNPFIRGALAVIVLIFFIGLIGLVIFVQPISAKETAKASAASTATVKVSNSSDLISFVPFVKPKAGFIFYPGAKVDPLAYSQSMRAIARAGFAVFVAKFPLNFAIISPNRANDITAANPEITHWAIGGHSLGGASACLYMRDSKKVKVLIFWAAYCDKSFDLSSRSDVQVTSISGSVDGLATPAKVQFTKVFAPENTKYVVIQGGNHAQFGDYGLQSGDALATITPESQRAQVVTATLVALEAMLK